MKKKGGDNDSANDRFEFFGLARYRVTSGLGR
jgi:hypothetical protein